MTIEIPVRPERTRPADSRANYRGMPRTHAGSVLSARTFARFARPEPLTVVRAPHGFGKSMLAAQWLRSMQDDEVDVVWLGPESAALADGEATETFWHVLGARLEELGTPSRRSGAVRGVVGRERVVSLLARRTRPVFVVLDRFEHLAGSRGVEQQLLELVQSMEHLFLIVCTREVTSLEVVGAATVDSVVLRPADLALGVEDVLSLAAQQDIALGREEAQQLVEETAGWPALVRVILAGSAADHAPGSTFALNLDAGRWFLRSAWDEFSLAGLGDFVMRTAVLVEFSRELAADLCPDGMTDEHIDALLAAGLLRSRQDGATTIYAHLPAVRRECMQRLRSEEPEAFQELSRVSARVLLEQGRAGQALVHLVRARLWDDVLTCVEENWTTLVAQGERELLQLIERLPEQVVGRSPRLIVLRDYAGGAETFTRGADRSTRPDVSDLGTLVGLSVGRLGVGEERTPGASAVERYQGLGEQVRRDLPGTLAEMAVSRLVAFDVRGAIVAYSDAHALAVAYADAAIEARCAIGATLAHVTNGDVRAATGWLDAHDAAMQRVEDRSALDAVAGATRAMLDVSRLDLGAARAALVGGDELPGALTIRAVVRAHLALFEHTRKDALDEIEKAVPRLEGVGTDLVATLMIAARVDLLLALGQVLRARAILARVDSQHDVLVLARARTAFMAGDYGRAALLAGQGLHAEQTGPRQRLGLVLVQAAAEDARGRRAEAVRSMREAVTIAQESQLLEPFAMLPRASLESFVDTVPEVGEIVSRCAEAGVEADCYPLPSMVAELSDREREVLETLAVSDSLGAVAKKLYLTTNTVKTHLRSIYRKLGTHSGAETVQRAVECGLIEAPTH